MRVAAPKRFPPLAIVRHALHKTRVSDEPRRRSFAHPRGTLIYTRFLLTRPIKLNCACTC